MKIHDTYEIKMPVYALPYLVNGDSSGLNDEDKNAIDNYMAQFYKKAELCNGYVYVYPNPEQTEYFTSSPAFGLACDVCDTTILIYS